MTAVSRKCLLWFHNSSSVCGGIKYARSQLFSVHRSLIKMSSTDAEDLGSPRPVIGVCQLTCTADKNKNLETSSALIRRAKARGAQMVFLPEACDYIGESKQQSMDMAESIQGEIINHYKKLAKDLDVWLSIGGFHEKGPENTEKNRVYNTHVVINSHGVIEDTYSKTHMFDLDIPGKVRLCESDYTIPGSKITPPVATPVGKVGMAICYDMRFPELSQALTQLGAEILTYPSAFTVPTGMAHWEVLLRNRAIECQCYVVAAAQAGRHNDKRSSYGHSMVIDPWGTVIAECPEGIGVVTAEIDLKYLEKVRTQMPVQQHHRHDLYGKLSLHTRVPIDSQEKYEFGHVKILNSFVFYRTALSYAFVNIKPVVPGHVLVSSIRPAPRFSDLTPAEVSDLFRVTQVISKVIEGHFGATSTTISVQDGPEAGQTVEHVHVHILPRKVGDFSENDDIYMALEKHDQNLEEERRLGKLRSEADMTREADHLRKYFY